MCFGKKKTKGANENAPAARAGPASAANTTRTTAATAGAAGKGQPVEDDRIVREVVSLRLLIQNHVDNFYQPKSSSERQDALREVTRVILQLAAYPVNNHADMINLFIGQVPEPKASTPPKAQREAHLRELFNLCSRITTLFNSQHPVSWSFDMSSLTPGSAVVFPALQKGPTIVREADTGS